MVLHDMLAPSRRGSCCTRAPLCDIPGGELWREHLPIGRTSSIALSFPLILEGELGRCRIIYQYITCGQSLIWCSGTLKEYGWKLMARKMLVSLSNGQKKHEDISALCAYQKMWPQQERILSSSDEVIETSQSFSGNLWHHSKDS